MAVETEIKVRLEPSELADLKKQMSDWGARVLHPRQEEKNRLYDYADGRLRLAGSTLRVRRYGKQAVLTYKGPVQADPMLKKRPEFQTEVKDAEALLHILNALGLEESFRYDKYREIRCWKIEGQELEVCFDETPVGTFAEIEGHPEAVRQAVEELGWQEKEFIRLSYPELYRRG